MLLFSFFFFSLYYVIICDFFFTGLLFLSFLFTHILSFISFISPAFSLSLIFHCSCSIIYYSYFTSLYSLPFHCLPIRSAHLHSPFLFLLLLLLFHIPSLSFLIAPLPSFTPPISPLPILYFFTFSLSTPLIYIPRAIVTIHYSTPSYSTSPPVLPTST